MPDAQALRRSGCGWLSALSGKLKGRQRSHNCDPARVRARSCVRGRMTSVRDLQPPFRPRSRQHEEPGVNGQIDNRRNYGRPLIGGRRQVVPDVGSDAAEGHFGRCGRAPMKNRKSAVDLVKNRSYSSTFSRSIHAALISFQVAGGSTRRSVMLRTRWIASAP